LTPQPLNLIQSVGAIHESMMRLTNQLEQTMLSLFARSGTAPSARVFVRFSSRSSPESPVTLAALADNPGARTKVLFFLFCASVCIA
jgi:hypothetical protein